MEFGAVLPTTEIGNDTGAVRAWAQAIEEMGFTRIIAYDHVLGAVHANREPPLWGPYSEDDPFREPMVLFGYLAGVTRHVELMTGVLILPQRQTALVAKQAIEIDLLSEGRFILGVGTGWNFVEYESLGTQYRNRARRFDEQIELLRLLWGERVIDFTGRYHRVDRAGLLPLPSRQIPVWFGGGSDAAMQRAAAIGDGFYFGAAGSRVEGSLERLRSMLVEQGRDPSSFPVGAQIHTGRGSEKCAAEAAGWKAAGGTHISVSTMSSQMLGALDRPCATVDDHLALLHESLQMLNAI
jgi:probable F420-dependent oxidoreductase